MYEGRKVTPFIKHKRVELGALDNFNLYKRKQLALVEASMEKTRQSYAHTYKKINENAFLEIIISKNGPRPLYYTRIWVKNPGKEEERRIYVIDPVFSAEWRIDYWAGYTWDNTLLNERHEIYYLNDTWKPKKKEPILQPRFSYGGNGMANWFSDDKKNILSWEWYSYVAKYEDPIPPYCSGGGAKRLWQNEKRTPIFEDAPYDIIGACIYSGKHVIATTDGVYYREDSSWVLVEGTETLFTQMQGEDGQMPVRFSGSGEKGVCVVTALAFGQGKKLLFDLSYNSETNIVSLASSNLEETVDYDSTPIGSCSYTSVDDDPICEVVSYTPPPDYPSYPDPVCNAPGSYPCDVSQDFYTYTDDINIGYGQTFNYVYKKQACTSWGCWDVQGEKCVGSSGLCNSNSGAQIVRGTTTGNSSSGSGSINATEILYAADWDGEDLVECFIELASYLWSTGGSSGSYVEATILGAYPGHHAADFSDVSGSSSDSSSRNRKDYIIIKKSGQQVLKRELLTETYSRTSSASWAYHYNFHLLQSDPGYASGSADVAMTESWYAKRLCLFGLDLRTYTILAVETDMGIVCSDSVNVPVGENLYVNTYDMPITWNTQCVVINLDGEFTHAIEDGSGSYLDQSNDWYSGRYDYQPCWEGNIYYWHISPEATWFTYDAKVTTTPSGDALFTYGTGGLWYPWSFVGWFYDYIPSADLSTFHEIPTICLIQGIFDKATNKIMPLKDIYPLSFTNSDTAAPPAHFTFGMSTYYGGNELIAVGSPDFLITHKDSTPSQREIIQNV